MKTFERRHDLDALRAGAMLLGIFYHASLSFAQGQPWLVADNQRHQSLYIFENALHGFRMQLFFVISGFFVAMLWRKKGLGYVLQHRLRRVLIPCMLGMLTIAPLTFLAMETTPPSPLYAPDRPVSNQEAIWQAVRWGNADGVERYLDQGGDPYITEHEFGASLLSMATYAGQKHIVALLIERGVDVNASDNRGNMPIHAAAYFGRADIVELLIQSGARLNEENTGGRTPLEMAQVSWPVSNLVSRWINIELDEEQTEAGKSAIIRQLLQTDETAEKQAGVLSALRSVPIFLHLWFLWYLWWFTVGFGACAILAERLNWRMPKPWLILSPACFIWLIPLTLIPGWLMYDYGGDISGSLLPEPHVMLYYAIFFLFGVLYFESRDTAARLGRRWWLTLPVALLVLLPLSLDLYKGNLGFFDQSLDIHWRRSVSIVMQVFYTWLMIFGCMGLVRALLKKESRLVRYLSDSAYWLYLFHVPLIIFAQSTVANWNLPMPVKLGLILVTVISFLLFTYEFFVRYTWLGSLLNGPRTRPK